MDAYHAFLSDFLSGHQISLWGVADLQELDPMQRQGLPYGICFAIALEVFPNTGNASEAYYREYRALNQRLKEIGYALEAAILEKGFRAYSLARNRQSDDYRTALPFKTLATRAGLGWIGKSSLLVTREYGSAVRLHGVLTDLPLVPNEPASGRCGNCRTCADACPGRAISGRDWHIGMDRDELIDPHACKQTVVERGKEMGVTVGSCGICVAVCPWTKRYIKQKTVEHLGSYKEKDELP